MSGPLAGKAEVVVPPPPSPAFGSQAQPWRVSSWGAMAPHLQESSKDSGPHQPRAVPSSQLQSLEQEKGRWRLEKAQLEQSVEENKERMEKLEGYWGEAQSLCQAVDEHLRETQAQYQALERKYSKAKRLIKDYQQKYVAGGWESWA